MRTKAGSRNTATPNAELVLSRDVMTKDHLLLGPDEGPSRDPDDAYKVTRIPLALNLPRGYTIALSVGMSWECWGPDGTRVELMASRTKRHHGGWFRASGAMWIVHTVEGVSGFGVIVPAVALIS